MQPRTDALYRPGLTNTDVFNLITASNLWVGSGCELVTRNLDVVADISDGFAGGTIRRGNLDTIHGTCDVTLETELDWGTALIRPYVVLKVPGPGGLTGRFNQGAYFTSTPQYVAGTTPRQFSVQGYDQLEALTSPVGDSYVSPAGVTYLSVIQSILVAQGYTQYVLDPARAGTIINQPRAWPIDQNTTWLSIINDLLAAIGYQGLWADWDGRLRANPYTPPSGRASEWFYDTTQSDTIMDTRKRSFDYFAAPNRWVSIRSNIGDGVVPVEGNGVYTFINQSDGKTSVDARGRVITKVLSIDAADQSALQTTASVTINADLRIDQVFDVTTGINPLHWHFDRVTLADSEFGAAVELQETSWTLALSGGSMSHSWTSV